MIITPENEILENGTLNKIDLKDPKVIQRDLILESNQKSPVNNENTSVFQNQDTFNPKTARETIKQNLLPNEMTSRKKQISRNSKFLTDMWGSIDDKHDYRVEKLST